MVKQFSETISTTTTFLDITDKLKKYVSLSGVKDGIVTTSSMHTTATLRIIENEKLLIEDLDNFLERHVPSCVLYQHDDIEKRGMPPEERRNGCSHLRTLYFNHSETIPVQNGIPLMGKWQSLFLVECDPIRDRTIVFTIIGEVS